MESTHPRFFRPADVGRIRRNQRRIQVQRLFAVARNVLIAAGTVLGAAALYRHTQSDSRFAVKTIEVAGAKHTPRAAVEAVTRRYIGLNLFQIDIARVQRDLGGVGWISRIEIEKKLPDTLRIRVVERVPAALVQTADGAIQYADDAGVAFAELSPSAGDADLPLIVLASGAELASGAGSASGAEVKRCTDMLRDLRARDPQLYSRVSEVRPLPPDGFAIFDRELGTVIYANGADLTTKWRDFYAIARAENAGRADFEYADLRFSGRVVVRPLHARALAAAPAEPAITTAITN
jgi:cell division protein FtsQ